MADEVTTNEEGLLTQEQMVAGLLGAAPIPGDTDSDPSPEVAAPETKNPEQPTETAAPAAPAEAPAPAAAPEAAPAPEPAGVLAADGKTIIPLTVLQQEREAARHWEKQARAFAEIADALAANRRADPAAAPAAAEAPETTTAPTAASAAEIARLVAAQVSRELEPIKRREHFGAIEAAHPDVKEIGANPAFEAWIEAHPSFVRDQYRAVRDGGTSAQVIEMLNAFKASQPKPAAAAAPAPAAPTKEQLAASAKAVVAGVKAAPPSSLSELPAGGAQVVDETTALLTMSPEAMREKFASKTPKEIEALLSRVL